MTNYFMRYLLVLRVVAAILLIVIKIRYIEFLFLFLFLNIYLIKYYL